MIENYKYLNGGEGKTGTENNNKKTAGHEHNPENLSCWVFG